MAVIWSVNAFRRGRRGLICAQRITRRAALRMGPPAPRTRRRPGVPPRCTTAASFGSAVQSSRSNASQYPLRSESPPQTRTRERDRARSCCSSCCPNRVLTATATAPRRAESANSSSSHAGTLCRHPDRHGIAAGDAKSSQAAGGTPGPLVEFRVANGAFRRDHPGGGRGRRRCGEQAGEREVACRAPHRRRPSPSRIIACPGGDRRT